MNGVVLTNHVVERFQERVRPQFDFDDAKRELARLVKVATFTTEPPEWARSVGGNNGYLQVGDDVCLCLRGHIATTCVVRGDMSPLRRAHINRVNSGRRYARGKRRKR